jgi:hypothetical protein
VAAPNVAMTEASAKSVTLQAPVPEHMPPQAVSVWFAPGVAVSATVLPSANIALHAPGQLMPKGWEVTVPPLVTDTLSVCRTGVTTVELKLA